MSLLLVERALQPERMDLEPLAPADARSILGALETINRWLGGVRATLFHLERFSLRWKPGERIRIIDWGTGGADLPRAIVDWGRRKGFAIEVTGVDNNPAVMDYARRACAGYPEIRLIETDVFETASSETYDYAISSLCLHHLTDSQIISLFQQSDRLTRRGIIMNDLKRSARAWLWIWLLTRMGRAHPIVKNDGPLSVQRAFRAEELQALSRQAGLSYLKVRTHFGYRLTLAGEKPRG